MDAFEGQLVRGVVGEFLAPEGLADLEGVVEEAAPLGEVEAGGPVLLFLPTDADTEVQASTGQDVEGGCRLGEYEGPSQRRQQDRGAETDPPGVGGEARLISFPRSPT
tara:strand:- start:2 stop:325 length:324 start_codon:yes stop_codon:yes gene_type:complete